MECSVSEYWYNKAEEEWTFYFKGEIGLTPDLRRRASNSENAEIWTLGSDTYKVIL